MRHFAILAFLGPALLLAASGCASSTPEWQRLHVQPGGEREHVFETVALVVSRRFPLEKKDLATGLIASRYVEERRPDGVFRWKATALVRSDRDGLVVAVSTRVEEFDEEDGFVLLGSVEEIDTMLVDEIAARLEAAAAGRGVRITRLDPIESPEGGDDGGTALAPPESRPPRYANP
jgi:hypothetical protein